MLRRLSALILLFFSATALAEVPRVAIIIDDLGYHLANGKRAISLPGPVAMSVLPSAPRARTLAQQAHANGKEVLLHLPLQAYDDDDRAEPAEIVLDMSRARVGDTFQQALEAVPHVVGINSHRGSLLTRHPGHMAWLMQEIAAREQLFFIDSFTTHQSVAMQIAEENGVDAVRRDIFLDPDKDPGAIAREFERLKEIARKRGYAIGIGHPYPATLELLEKELPRLAEEGFKLVRVSELVK
ncbi:MAG: divergent polysaccharide deacetylase family protein [Woeseiaceae bacterium]|nr:divergent polysaccharide deacetylase family protein [Woeseiaceae bacterium]